MSKFIEEFKKEYSIKTKLYRLDDEDVKNKIMSCLNKNDIHFKVSEVKEWKTEWDRIHDEYVDFCDEKYDKPFVEPDDSVLKNFLIYIDKESRYWVYNWGDLYGEDSNYFDESTWNDIDDEDDE